MLVRRESVTISVCVSQPGVTASSCIYEESTKSIDSKWLLTYQFPFFLFIALNQIKVKKAKIKLSTTFL